MLTRKEIEQKGLQEGKDYIYLGDVRYREGETVRKSVFGKLLMITTSLRQTEKAGIRVCFMSKAAPTGEIWFRSNLTRVCLIRQRKGLKITKFITRKFIQ